MKENIIGAVKKEAERIGVSPSALLAFIEVESSGRGFDPKTNKIIIQFEPYHFRKRTSVQINNRVGVQSVEWRAFNKAFSIDPNSAMESTSIGLGQIMGFHWKRLGYPSVGDMWDDAKKGEERQIFQIAEFIRTDRRLFNALKNRNWHVVAKCYNGSQYQALARKLNITPYNKQLEKAFKKYDTKF